MYSVWIKYNINPSKREYRCIFYPPLSLVSHYILLIFPIVLLSPHVSTLPASSAPEWLHAVPSWLHLRRPTTSDFVTRRSSSAPVFQHNTQASGHIDSSCQAPTFGNYDAYASAPLQLHKMLTKPVLQPSG